MKKENSSNSQNSIYLKEKCPLLHTMEQINGRWKILLLWYISLGANRFGKLKQGIPTITTKMLSQQLRELEADELLTRTIFAEMPPRVEYALTEKSKRLFPILEKLYEWGVDEKERANK
jgi:DNA-binding HxlR family transcriptional regulator